MKYWLILLIFTPLFSWFAWSQGFPDPDSYYHLKLSKLIYEQGIVTDFPWLPLTTLGTHYADHQLLYHVVLSLFLFMFPPLLAAKVLTVSLAVGALLLFYWFLIQQKVHFPFLFTCLLGLNADFIFRLNLTKTVSCSFIFLLLCFHLMSKKRYFWLFVLSFLYVWLYAGFVMAGIVWGAYLVSGWFCAWMKKERFAWRESSLLGVSIFGGLCLGLIVNPYFPSNLFFYYEQIIRIALINQIHEQVNVGMEWFAYDPQAFFLQNLWVWLIWISALVIFVLHLRKPKTEVVCWGLLSFFFLFFTLKSQRNIEYFVPSSLVFSALCVSAYVRKEFWGETWREIQKWMKQDRWFCYIQRALFGCLLVLFCINVARGLSATAGFLQDVIPESKFAKASAFLKEKKGRVFHTSWDEFPMLFYHNDQSTYVAGLDPTFFYDKDPLLYRVWMDLVLGTKKTDIYATIKQDFGASWVLINKDHPALHENIKLDDQFVLVYEDEDVWIYLL